MRIVVLGGGESGIGAALLAKKLKYEVFVSDAGKIPASAVSELKNKSIPFEEMGHTIDRLKRSDIAIKSPGIPGDVPVIRALRNAGIAVISEVEFASRYCPGKILAITGSNGKTTTSMLCHHLLIGGGYDAVLCGNVGLSFARVLADDPPHQWYVVEVSSFQLDDVVEFSPDIGMILNITPDHLDRYQGKFDLYAEAKFNIARRMSQGSLLIYNADMHSVTSRIHGLDDNCRLCPVHGEGTDEIDLGEFMVGKHNEFNARCALAAMDFIGVANEDLVKGLRTFNGPGHRMESVGSSDGIRFVNDSKATNVEAVYYALEAIDGPIVWLAGGQDKGNDYDRLHDLVADKVKALICIGIDNEKLKMAFSATVKTIKETTDMTEAVSMAASIAVRGDTVLLSPACASFDLYENYEDRGDQFALAVERITG